MVITLTYMIIKVKTMVITYGYYTYCFINNMR